MIKQYVSFGYLVILLMIFTSCNDKPIHSSLNSSNVKPPPVTNVDVKPLHGGAKITYDIPSDGNIRSVKAIYKRGNSKVVEKSSSYNKNIIIKGIADTTTHKIKFHTVNRANNKSKPVVVKINALLPPIVSVFNSIQIQKAFGGVGVAFKNQYKGKVRISVITKDSSGNYGIVENYYTQRKKGNFFATGFPAKKREFGVFVRNQWQAYSDTIFKSVTPLFEEKVPKSGFEKVDLPTDINKEHCCGTGLNELWDGVTNVHDEIFQSIPGTGFPQWFTIDLGVKVKISRFKMYSRRDVSDDGQPDGSYSVADPRVIILWGSNHPDGTGEFDETWHKLGRFVATKPSGLPGTEYTADDAHLAVVEGHQFRIKNVLEKPAVRYIRFETVDTWGFHYGNGINLAELTFWGQIKKTFN